MASASRKKSLVAGVLLSAACCAVAAPVFASKGYPNPADMIQSMTPPERVGDDPFEGFRRLTSTWRAFFVKRVFVGDALKKEQELTEAWWSYDLSKVYLALDGKYKGGRQQVFIGKLNGDHFEFRLPQKKEKIVPDKAGEASVAVQYRIAPDDVEGNKLYFSRLKVDLGVGPYTRDNMLDIYPQVFALIATPPPAQPKAGVDAVLRREPALANAVEPEAGLQWMSFMFNEAPKTMEFVTGFFDFDRLGVRATNVRATDAQYLTGKDGRPLDVAFLDIDIHRNKEWVNGRYQALEIALRRAAEERIGNLSTTLFTKKGHQLAEFSTETGETRYTLKGYLTRDGLLPTDKDGKVAERPFNFATCGAKFHQIIRGVNSTSGVTIHIENWRLNWEVQCKEDRVALKFKMARAPDIRIEGMEALRAVVDLLIPGSLEGYAQMFFDHLAGANGAHEPLAVQIALAEPGPESRIQIDAHVPLVSNRFMEFILRNVARNIGPRRVTRARLDFLRAQQDFIEALQADVQREMAARGKLAPAAPGAIVPASGVTAPAPAILPTPATPATPASRAQGGAPGGTTGP
jgi:hypothetical protein